MPIGRQIDPTLFIEIKMNVHLSYTKSSNKNYILNSTLGLKNEACRFSPYLNSATVLTSLHVIT